MTEMIQIKPRWQITIPKVAREIMGLTEGGYLVAELGDAALILKPLRRGIVARPQPASRLKKLRGAVAVGGDAVKDSRRLYK